jgi:hypothetical protein
MDRLAPICFCGEPTLEPTCCFRSASAALAGAGERQGGWIFARPLLGGGCIKADITTRTAHDPTQTLRSSASGQWDADDQTSMEIIIGRGAAQQQRAVAPRHRRRGLHRRRSNVSREPCVFRVYIANPRDYVLSGSVEGAAKAPMPLPRSTPL